MNARVRLLPKDKEVEYSLWDRRWIGTRVETKIDTDAMSFNHKGRRKGVGRTGRRRRWVGHGR